MFFEIEGLQGVTPASPMVGGASEIPQPHGVHQARKAIDLRERQRLGIELTLETSALDQIDPQPCIGEGSRQRDSRGTRSDDADIALEDTAIFERSGIDEHQF